MSPMNVAICYIFFLFHVANILKLLEIKNGVTDIPRLLKIGTEL